MLSRKPVFIRPGDDTLYPIKNKDGVIETLVNPNIDSALSIDKDAQTSFVYNRYHHLPLEAQRQKLPVFQYRNHILYLLEKYQTLILIGETGCGKSTQVPQYLHEIGHKVCVTQPRVAAALSLASRVADERGEPLGDCVGYAAAMASVRAVHTGIVFMTEGVLLREMFASPLLMQYSCIVLDEVHERSQMTDVLMGLLKKIAKKRKNLKIVVSSATMDADFLKEFFNLNDKKDKSRSTSVVMAMQGRTHPIDVFYVEEPVPDYVKATVDTVIKIHENEPFGDILAFLTSQEEILAALDILEIYASENNEKNKYRKQFPNGISAANLSIVPMYGSLPHYKQVKAFQMMVLSNMTIEEILAALDILETYASENNEKNKYRKQFPNGISAANLSIVPMYGSLPHYKQVKAFQMSERNVRKVVLATNIAETSVTIPGVVYVIDCGFHKLPHFDPAVGVESVSVCPVSKHNATQRAGRAGRTSRGKCYRLYTETDYDDLPPSVPPEMCRSDLSALLLQLKALGIHNLLRFTFPTAPPAKSLLAGLETLYALKAIDKEGDLTEDLGVKMAEVPLKPTCAKMLCSSGDFGCIDEILSIVSMLQVDGIFTKHATGRDNIAARISRRNNFEVAEGDIIMYLNIFDSYLKVRSGADEKRAKKACKDWCQKMYINYRVMEKAVEIRNSLDKLVKNKFGLTNATFEGLDLGTEKCVRVMKAVLSGLFPQAAYLSPDNTYRGIRGAVLHISPDSCLYHVQQPKWVVFASVQSASDKTYMREMMTIDKQWLTEIAPHYYRET